jgi:hypothetical protein
MIEKFYASRIKNQLSAAAINVKRFPKYVENKPATTPEDKPVAKKRRDNRPKSAGRKPHRGPAFA